GAVRPCCHFETRWRLQNAVSVAHPNAPHAVQEAGALDGIKFAGAVLALRRGFHVAAHFFADKLHPVTNTQDRDAQLENAGIGDWSVPLINRRGAAGQYNSLRILGSNLLERSIERDNLRIDVGLANSAAD